MARIWHLKPWRLCLVGVLWGICWSGETTAAPVVAAWIDGTGDWTDGTRWSTSPDYPNNGTPVGATYNVVVDAPSATAYTVSLSGVTVTIDSLLVDSANATVRLLVKPGVSGPRLEVFSGIEVAAGTFDNSGGSIANTRIYGTGGAVLLDSGLLDNVVLDHDATSGRGQLIRNGLSLNSTWTLTHKYAAYTPEITFDGSQTLTGGGSVVLDDPDSQAKILQRNYTDSLVIDSGMTIRTGAAGGGLIGNNNFSTLPSLINYGLISAETAGKTLAVGSAWVNQGVMQIKNGSTLKLDGVYSSASLGTINNTGGTLQFGGKYNNTGNDLVIAPAMGTTQIVGTITGGTLSVASGATLLPGGGTFDGVTLLSDYTVDGGATFKGGFHNNAVIHVPSGSYLTLADVYTKADCGDIRAEEGQVNLTGTWDLGTDAFDFNSTTGSWRLTSFGKISGGTLTAHDGQGLTIYSGTLDHVTLAMRPSVPYQQDCSISNGLTFLPGGGIDVTSTNYFWFRGTQTLSGDGDIRFTYKGEAIIEAGSTLTIGPGVTIHGNYESEFYCQSHLLNEGTLSALPGSGRFVVHASYPTVPFENRNLMEAPTGSQLEISIGPGFSNTGLLRSLGGELRLGGTFTPAQLARVENQGGVVGISGVMDNTNNTLTLDAVTGSWTLLGGGTIQGGRICGEGGAQLLTGIKDLMDYSDVYLGYLADGVVLDIVVNQLRDTSVSVTGGLTVNQPWSIDGSHLANSLGFNGTQLLQGDGVLSFINGNAASIVSLSGTLTIGPDITIRSLSGGGTIGSATRTGVGIVNEGLISSQTSSKTITISGRDSNFTNSGVLEARNGGTLLVNEIASNLSGVQLTGGSWQVFANSTLRLVGADIQTNAAEIVLDGENANVYSSASGTGSALSNFAVNAAEGRFVLRNGRDFTTTGALANSGILSVGSATVLNTPGGLTNAASGRIEGRGVYAGNVFNGGAIAPGDEVSPTGLLTFQGDLTGQTGSQFLMELGGTTRGSTYDAVNLDGILHREGALRVSLTGGFQPDQGMSFDLFDFTAADGQFVVLDLPTLPDGLSWDSGNLYTTGTLQVVPEPSSLVLLGMGAIGWLAWARRRRRS
ncbi:MAG: PEP-CTERM sorting domain-containing protein [Pirellulales bacterium]|nr:PEP-CTERM sorting domain-containing protein [Pirellulales bacterium]